MVEVSWCRSAEEALRLSVACDVEGLCVACVE